MRPETQFTRVGDVYLAYQVVGTGERAIVLASGGPTHIEGFWDVPQLARFVEQMSRFGRVLVFDKRGVGLSDRVSGPITVEQSADDVVHVMDAAGMDQAVLFGMIEGRGSLPGRRRPPPRACAGRGHPGLGSDVRARGAVEPAGRDRSRAAPRRRRVMGVRAHSDAHRQRAGR